MELTGPIESAEKQFIQILERYFVSIYDEKKLPSHGLNHHRRVWANAKKLLLNLPPGSIISDRLPYTLILASYMHDLGMATDHGPKHGRQSMELCRTFVRNNELDEDDFPGLMHAIREHDNKDYTSSAGTGALDILSMADDLDAFGFTGIYRYTEIYLLRGIDPASLGYKIRTNARQRFEHFSKIFCNSGTFFEQQKQKYLILDGFFKEYDKEISLKKPDSNVLYYTGVVRMLSDIIRNQQDIFEFAVPAHYDNPVAKVFFEGLAKELASGL
jgi:HD superfamily phosphodiesterase